MAIREDLVASAVSRNWLKSIYTPLLTVEIGTMSVLTLHPLRSSVTNPVTVLQDPNVASSSVDNRISFLRTKNLTQEEIDAALARTGSGPPPPPASQYGPPATVPPQQYYQPYPHQAWQPPQPPPRRDWRDWFIMATVVSGVSYGLYSLGKVSRNVLLGSAIGLLTCGSAMSIPSLHLRRLRS
jgi:peroxin-14